MAFDICEIQNSFFGFDDLFKDVEVFAKSKSVGYPPYNVRKIDNKYIIEIGVAGFKRDNLTVAEQKADGKRLLIISGNRPAVKSNHENERVIHNSLAKRDFKLYFHLSENVNLCEVKLEDGMLLLNLEEVHDEASCKPYEIK